jgi:hypothetical protein
VPTGATAARAGDARRRQAIIYGLALVCAALLIAVPIMLVLSGRPDGEGSTSDPGGVFTGETGDGGTGRAGAAPLSTSSSRAPAGQVRPSEAASKAGSGGAAAGGGAVAGSGSGTGSGSGSSSGGGGRTSTGGTSGTGGGTAAGQQGPAGPQGPQGPAGPQGPKGDPGAPASSSSSAPASSAPDPVTPTVCKLPLVDGVCPLLGR